MGSMTQWGGWMAGLGRWATLMCTSEKKNLSCSYHGRMSGPAQACARARVAWLGLAWLGLAWLGLAWHGLAWLGMPLTTRSIPSAGQRAHAGIHSCPMARARAHTCAHTHAIART